METSGWAFFHDFCYSQIVRHININATEGHDMASYLYTDFLSKRLATARLLHAWSRFTGRRTLLKNFIKSSKAVFHTDQNPHGQGVVW